MRDKTNYCMHDTLNLDGVCDMCRGLWKLKEPRMQPKWWLLFFKPRGYDSWSHEQKAGFHGWRADILMRVIAFCLALQVLSGIVQFVCMVAKIILEAGG